MRQARRSRESNSKGTVGELTARLVVSSERTSDFLGAVIGVVSSVATLAAIVAALTTATPRLGNGAYLVAAFIATAASIALGSAIALVAYLRERAKSRREKPVSASLTTLEKQQVERQFGWPIETKPTWSRRLISNEQTGQFELRLPGKPGWRPWGHICRCWNGNLSADRCS